MRVKSLISALVFIFMTSQSLFGWRDLSHGITLRQGWVIVFPNPVLPVPIPAPAYFGFPIYRPEGSANQRTRGNLQDAFKPDSYASRTTLRRHFK